MLIPLTDLQIIYENIVLELNLSYTSVLIFVAFDTDSVCSLKILTGIFKSQSILYEVYPVATYSNLEEKIESAKNLEKVKVIFFINCGGALNLTQKWFCAGREQQPIQVFLLDVHKPIHHANISHKYIKVVNDGHSNVEKCPTNNDILKLAQIQQNQMELDSDQEQELVYQSQPDRPELQRNKLQYQKKQLKAELNNKIDQYYGKQYSGLPTSYIIMRLARDLNKISNDYLWLAMIGLTSLFLESKMSKETYNKTESYLNNLVVKLNFSITKNAGDSIGSIYKQMDFRFILLRHWTLFNSIRYSPYMVAKLRLWDDYGINKMKDFIIQIGVSLQDAQQNFSYTSKQALTEIRQELLKKAETFELFDICFSSFKKQIDTYESFACSDMFYAITAALEESSPEGAANQKIFQARRQNFWIAYQLLDDGRIQDTKHFIQNQKIFSKILVTQALDILQKNQINPCYSFLYVKFINNTLQRKLFQHPFRLIKLGKLLMQLYHQKKRSKNKIIKPLIISIENQQNPYCMLAGIVPQIQNPFAAKFIKVAQKNNLNNRHDGFNANIIEIKKEDLVKFIAQLNF